jgi:hypothetical protein
VQLLGGAREIHVPGGGGEHPQLPQRHVLHGGRAYPGLFRKSYDRDRKL